MSETTDSGLFQNFTPLSEGDNHFLVRNEETGIEAPVPKAGLSEDHQKELRANMKFEPDPKELGPSPGFLEGLFPRKPLTPEQQKAWEGNIASNVGNAISDFFPASRDTAGNPVHPQPIAPVATQTPSAPVAPQAPQVADTQQAAPIAPVPMMDAGYENAWKQQRAGITGAAESMAQGEQAKANAAQTQQDMIVATQQEFAKKRSDLDAEQAQLQKDVADAKIDPHQFWNKQTGIKGGANRVLSFLGFILGGVAQNKTGVNPAQQMLQKAMDEDIDAQKQELNKKQNLLSQNLKKYENLQAAETATRLDMANMFAAQLQQITAQTNSEVVKQNATLALGQLNQNIAGMKDALATQHVTKQIQAAVTGGANIPDEVIATLPKEQRESLVKVRDVTDPTDQGKWRQAKTPEAAKEINKLQSVSWSLVDVIRQMKEMRKKYGTSYLPGTDERQEYENLHGQALRYAQEIGASAKTNENVYKLLEKYIPNPGSFFTSDKELDMAEDYVKRTLNNELANAVYGMPMSSDRIRKPY